MPRCPQVRRLCRKCTVSNQGNSFKIIPITEVCGLSIVKSGGPVQSDGWPPAPVGASARWLCWAAPGSPAARHGQPPRFPAVRAQWQPRLHRQQGGEEGEVGGSANVQHSAQGKIWRQNFTGGTDNVPFNRKLPLWGRLRRCEQHLFPLFNTLVEIRIC